MNSTYRDYISEFKEASGNLINLVNELDTKSLNTTNIQGSWTPAQVAEHLNKSYYGMNLLMAGPTQSTTRNPAEHIAIIKSEFLNFENKSESPEFVRPEIRDYDKEALIEAIKASSEQLIATAETKDLSETCTMFPFPVFGHLTRLELVAFCIYHTMRHTQQIRNIIDSSTTVISSDETALVTSLD